MQVPTLLQEKSYPLYRVLMYLSYINKTCVSPTEATVLYFADYGSLLIVLKCIILKSMMTIRR